MNCKYHNKKEGNIHCNMCQKALCEECTLNIDGKIYCRDCLKLNFKNETRAYNNTHKTQNREINKLALFIFSLFPGFGQMYLGYMKRGILISIIAILFGTFTFSIGYLIMTAYSFFDTINIKHNIQNGINVEDNIEDIKKLIKENKTVFIFLLIVAIIIGLAITTEICD